VSLRKQLAILVLFFFSFISLLAGLSDFALNMTSTVRACIIGEGYWSKAQKTAIYELARYVSTNDSKYYLRFSQQLLIPKGDSKARIELQKEDPDLLIVDQGLIQGGSDPSEVRAMGLLFKRFGRLSYVQRATESWSQGDQKLQELENIADELKRRIDRKMLSPLEQEDFLRRIDVLNGELTEIEYNFSKALELGLRWLRGVLVMINFLALLFFSMLGAGGAYFLSKPFLKDIESLRVGTERVQRGDLKMRISVISKSELNELARSFNQMTESLAREIGEREKAQAQVVNSSKMAALGEMAGSIAHEINTPLGAIILNAEMIETKNSAIIEPDADISKRVHFIIDIGYRISKIIGGLSNFSRDAKDDEHATFTARDLIESTIALCGEKFKNNEVHLKIEESQLETPIHGQIIQLSQVLLNLLNNSYDAIQGLEKKYIQIGVSVHGESLRIRVTDCGTGIPLEIAEKIFRPFYTTKGVGKGTGLGLSISREIVQNHSGNLYYDHLSRNTSFVIELPIRDSSARGSF
jgi:hypothetical protein